MIASAGQHSLFTGRSLVFPIWWLICILVGCTFTILKRSMDNGFVQTVADNMKLFTKRQIEGALKARHHFETLGYPSNADVLRAGGIGGCTLTADDARVANKIWGDSVPRLQGSTVRETGKRKPQSLVKVPREPS